MPETDTLVHCPFYGCTRAEIASCPHGTETAYFVRCLGCAAEGPWAKTEAGAIAAWNRRPSRPLITAVVSERSGGEGRWWFFRDDSKAARFMKACRESLGLTAWIDKPRDGDDESTWPVGELSPSSPAATEGDPAGSEGGATR